MKHLLLTAFTLLIAFMLAPAARGEIKSEMIDYAHGDVALRGFVAYDAARTGKRPAVLVCHEWWGMNETAQEKCKQLAKEGYVAFALDMYGKGQVTTEPAQASAWLGKVFNDPKLLRERAAAGLKVLTSRPECDASKVAVTGYCMGGTIALELARTGADLKAVVCFHTSNIAAKDPADNAKIKGKVLVCNGADDTMVKQEEKAAFMKQMKEAKIDHQFIEYGGAVHAFTNPQADTFKIPSVGYNAAADKRSWRAMKGLFDEVFA